MITFCIALLVLIGGYFIYGKFIERVFGIEPDRKTPAIKNPRQSRFCTSSPRWKIFMIQFLNIAGLGPIFRSYYGSKIRDFFFLWIVFGTIFAGAVHDYLSG